MSGWLTFWSAFLIGSLVLFAGLVVVVSVRGFADIRALVQHQRDRGDAGR